MTLPEEKLPSKSPFLSGLNMFYGYVLTFHHLTLRAKSVKVLGFHI